jgi:hypothetical protein
MGAFLVAERVKPVISRRYRVVLNYFFHQVQSRIVPLLTLHLWFHLCILTSPFV